MVDDDGMGMAQATSRDVAAPPASREEIGRKVARLYNENASKIMAWLMTKDHHVENCEDMFMEMMTRVQEALLTGNGPRESEENWMWTIARNVFNDFRRRRTREVATQSIEALAESLQEEIVPEQHDLRHTTKEKLDQMIGEAMGRADEPDISARQQAVRSAFGQLTVNERRAYFCSKALDLSAADVRDISGLDWEADRYYHLVHTAKAKLQDALEAFGLDDRQRAG